MSQVSYCGLTADQYDEMTADQYDTMLDCDGDDEGHGGTDIASMRRLRRMRPELRPIIIPFLDLDEIDELLQEGTL